MEVGRGPGDGWREETGKGKRSEQDAYFCQHPKNVFIMYCKYILVKWGRKNKNNTLNQKVPLGRGGAKFPVSSILPGRCASNSGSLLIKHCNLVSPLLRAGKNNEVSMTKGHVCSPPGEGCLSDFKRDNQLGWECACAAAAFNDRTVCVCIV